MNEIVEITVRRHHSISTQIGRMVKQGLVKKIKSHADLRGYNIVITEKGQELFKRITRDSIKKCFLPVYRKRIRRDWILDLNP